MTLTRNPSSLMLGFGLVIFAILGFLGISIPLTIILIWMLITGILILVGR